MQRKMYSFTALLVVISLFVAGCQGYTTCKTIKDNDSTAPSGVYSLYLPSGYHEAYCEMGINSGGYTFLSNKMFARLTQADINVLFTQKTNVLLRISRPDGTQPYTVIKHLDVNKPLTIKWNQNAGYVNPLNVNIRPYLYLSFYSIAQTTSAVTHIGFISNGKQLKYGRCNNGLMNYIAFFSNPNEVAPSAYHSSNLVYERQGLAVDWRNTAIRPHSTRRMPLDNFLLTELHFPCAVYTSSDRWLTAKSPALGTAIGLK